MLVQFKRFLSKVKKSNGDKLLPITIEKYSYFVGAYIKKFNGLEEEELSILMNNILKQRNNVVIYSAFKMYLFYLGYERDAEIIRKLTKPAKTASALSSKRFLQSKVLSRGELKRIFNEVKKEELKLVFSILYDTACRRAELLSIKFGDITFIDKNKFDNNIYGKINVLGKGAKSREVYFGKVTYDLLMKLRPNRDKEKKLFEFYGSTGKLLKKQQDYLYRIIKDTIYDILGRHITPHCFRHTALTALADNGADILGISRYAGHSNIATSTIYIEISNRVGKLTFENYSKDIIDKVDA